MMSQYSKEDVDRMREIQEELVPLIEEVVEITRGDSHTEAYFTARLKHAVLGGGNPYDLDFDKVIAEMEKSLVACKVCEETDGGPLNADGICVDCVTEDLKDGPVCRQLAEQAVANG
jgi:hypothetical protein